MLGEPALLSGLSYSETVSKLLGGDGVTRVLCIGAVYEILFQVDEDSTQINVTAHTIRKRSGGMEKSKKTVLSLLLLEEFVTSAVEEVLTVGNIE